MTSSRLAAANGGSVGRTRRVPILKILASAALAVSLGAPLVARASHTQWLCEFDPGAIGRSVFQFFSTPGDANDTVQISGRGSCTAGLGSHGGLTDFGGYAAPATISGFQTEALDVPMALGACDNDGRSQRGLFQVEIPLVIRVFDGRGNVTQTFQLVAEWSEPPRGLPTFPAPFPGPGLHTGTLLYKQHAGNILMNTRVAGRCPPDGTFAAKYTLRFSEFQAFEIIQGGGE